MLVLKLEEDELRREEEVVEVMFGTGRMCLLWFWALFVPGSGCWVWVIVCFVLKMTGAKIE